MEVAQVMAVAVLMASSWPAIPGLIGLIGLAGVAGAEAEGSTASTQANTTTVKTNTAGRKRIIPGNLPVVFILSEVARLPVGNPQRSMVPASARCGGVG